MIGTQINADFQDAIKRKRFSAFVCENLLPFKQKGFV